MLTYLYACGGVRHISRFVFALVSFCIVRPLLPVSRDWPYMVALQYFLALM